MAKVVIMLLFFFAFAYAAYAGETQGSASYKDLFNMVVTVLLMAVGSYVAFMRSTFTKAITEEKDARKEDINKLTLLCDKIFDKMDDLSKEIAKEDREMNKLLNETLTNVKQLIARFEANKEDHGKRIDILEKRVRELEKTKT